ncbi:MAG: phosphate ABC transporter ATP-binding protein [Lachnospiraceae bacterium]|nr:phosphate ABC transporter ATP-binding protein [Lachnospiraceae bacterium]
METIMDVRNLTVSYEGKAALKDVTVSFPKNEITAIIGPSGCGKTTLLQSLNGLITEISGVRCSGEIQLEGQSIDGISKEVLRKRVGIVFQTPMPFPFSVYKNLTYAPKYYGIHKKSELDRIVEEKLRMVGLYEEIQNDLHKSALKFSGGQQQRICIARALTVEPEVILLDEPCSALDVQSTAVIEKTLLELKKRYSLIIVTHNIAQAKRLSDRVVFLKDGRMVETAKTSEFFAEPKEKESQEFLGGMFG